MATFFNSLSAQSGPKLKYYTVQINDWQGTGYEDFLAENHAEAVSLCREWMRMNGRMRNDGPVTYRPRVKRSVYDSLYR